MAVAFLEAAINEILQDIVDGHKSYIGDVDPVLDPPPTELHSQRETRAARPAC